MTMKKIPITRYLTINSTEEAHNLAVKHGYKPVSYQDLFHTLNEILYKNGEEALREFALIHPDRALFIEEQKQEATSSATGMKFSCDSSEKTSSAVGTTEGETFKFDFKAQLPYIIGGAVAITILAIVIKKI
ncbi:MAG: hypothetical protein WCI04_06920 [archaeon]